MKTFVCRVCRHIAFDEAPVECPVCGMPIENFENVPDAVKTPADPDNLSESDRKHIPVVSISGECGMEHGDGCIDVHVNVGEIEHVMEAEHFIRYIDFYVSKKYVARILLTPKRVHPAATVHITADTGKLTVIGNCNVHGSWITKVKLDGD